MRRKDNKYINISILVILIIFTICGVIYIMYNKFMKFNNIKVTKPIFDIVISVYEEDINWIKEIPNNLYNHIFIYNKGSAKKINISNCSIIELPNVGYEAHTYLYHIIHNYNKLYNCTLFLPGTVWSQPYKRYQMLEIINILINKPQSTLCGISTESFIEKQKSIVVNNYSFTNKNNRKHNMNTQTTPAEIRPYGEWFIKRFNNEPIKSISFNGIFAALNEDILKRKIDFYINLLNEVSYKDPEAAHYIERSWSNIVSIPYDNTHTGLTIYKYAVIGICQLRGIT